MTKWATAKLGQVVTPVERRETPLPGMVYRQVGVRLWGQGAYQRDSIDGSETKYKTLSRVEADDLIVNKIWARNGSVALISERLAGSYVSGEFPTFKPTHGKIKPRWLHWLTKTPSFWNECDEKSRGTSGKNRIRPDRFLEIEIPLPPLAEQGRIVMRIESLVEKIGEATHVKDNISTDERQLVAAVFNKLLADAKLHSMKDAAPITRRPIQVDMDRTYPELGIRSFGNGTFHKPALPGIEVGSKKLFYMKPGDLVFSNVFAWEGAVAVVKPGDHGRVGSHRFIACVPQTGVATAGFLCFYFLTAEGLKKLGDASPGGAGRNRTLGLEALSAIQVPLPSYEKQLWFDELQFKVGTLKTLQAKAAAEIAALLPSILDMAFKGEL